jgi:anti-sigma factor ChrR (cupin superfamily)
MPSSLDAAEIDRLPITGGDGHRWRVLWDDGDAVAGVLDLVAGEHLPRHLHRDGEHHFWIERGSCEAGGRSLDPGSYVHVGPGVRHEDLEAGSRGCRLFFVYHRGRA